jgi:hypothetical protein
MDIAKPVRFLFVALGAVFAAMLAFGASLAGATTTPSSAFTWPEPGPTGTGSTLVAILLPLGVMLAALVYSVVALRRTSAVSEARKLRLVPNGPEAEERGRKAA